MKNAIKDVITLCIYKLPLHFMPFQLKTGFTETLYFLIVGKTYIPLCGHTMVN